MISFLIWIFTYIPVLFVHILPIVGIIGFISSFFILVPLEKDFVKLISVIVFMVGIYFEGGYAVTNEYTQKEKEWQQKIQVAEEKAKAANGKIEYVFKDRVQVVKDVQIVVQEKLRDVAVTIDSKCKITKETVDIHNEAAKSVRDTK
jgi:hypothetical protein